MENDRRIAAAGAALIWGHHPHVLQSSAHQGIFQVIYPSPQVYASRVYQKTADNMKPAAVKMPPRMAHPH
jgi:hypothetical protein